MLIDPPAPGRIVDLRRQEGPPPVVPGVLEDPSGRRRAHLRRAGRIITLMMGLWLVALVLGGLGLVPVPGVPQVISLRPSSGPPEISARPHPRPARPADRVAARPASAATVATPSERRAAGHNAPASVHRHAPKHGASETPGSAKTAPVPASTQAGQAPASPSITKGSSTSAPGQTQTAPGRDANTVPGDPTPPSSADPYGRGGKHATTEPAA